ncbi:MAG: hypothetical protein ACOC0U_02980 [Desulfovibrionales bacterium]
MEKRQKKPHERAKSLSQELNDLDRKLTELLVRRSELMARSAERRVSKNAKLVDPREEKALWKIWKEVRDARELDPRIWEQIFNLTNALSYSRAEKSRSMKDYTLFPRRTPFSLATAGPPSSFCARLHLCLAAVGERSLHLKGAVLNDPTIELIKLLNQAGASIEWNAEGDINVSRDRALHFNRKSIFCGQNPLNFFFALSLAVHGLGTCRLTGGTRLKTLDLHPLRETLSTMGARVVHLDPHSSGLPVRIESTGRVPEEFEFKAITPPEFVQAFIVVSAALGKRISVSWPDEMTCRALPGSVAQILADTTYAQIQPSGIEFPEKGLTLPEHPHIPLDPVLSAYLMALPLGAEGNVLLTGRWPARADAEEIQFILQQVLELEIHKEEVRTGRKGDYPATVSSRKFSPLGFAALLLTSAQEYRWGLTDEDDIEFADDFLRSAGFEYEWSQSALVITGRTVLEPPTVSAPTSEWGMAMALVAFRLQGLVLRNPGIVASLWPGFWKIYNSLHKQDSPEKKGNGNERKRKRILT